MTNGSGRALCRPSIGSSQTSSNKKRRKPYYEEDLRWKEVTWTLTSPSSNRQYDMRGLTKTIRWCSTSSQTDYQQRCMKTSTPTSNPARMNNGDMKPLINKKLSYTSKRDLTVGVPHLPQPQDKRSTISGGELPETITQWTPLKDVSDQD